MDDPFQRLISVLEHRRLVTYIDVASAFLFVYDFLLNLDAEIKYIYEFRRWSHFEVLYILQRYLPFLDMCVSFMHLDFSEGLSLRGCKIHYQVTGWCFLGGIVLSEVMLTYRIVAVWDKDIRAILVLFGLLFGCMLVTCVFFYKFLASMQFMTVGWLDIPGCFVVSADLSLLYGTWVALMVYDTGASIMVLIPRMKARGFSGAGRSRIFNAVYRDGAIYYALIFLISLVNVIVIKTVPPDLSFTTSCLTRVLHAIFASRAVLRIRQAVVDTSVTTHHTSAQDVPMASLNFSPPTLSHSGLAT